MAGNGSLGLALQFNGTMEVGHSHRVEHPLVLAHHLRSQRGDLLGHASRLRGEFVRRHDTPHQAPRQRLRRRELLAEQHECLGTRESRVSRERRGEATRDEHADGCLGQLEPGARRGNHHVCIEHPLQPGSDSPPVHRCDHGLRQVDDGLRDGLDKYKVLVSGCSRDVAPGTERLSAAVETTTRTDGSLLAVVNADNKSRDRSWSIAFSFSGRFSDSVSTPS